MFPSSNSKDRVFSGQKCIGATPAGNDMKHIINGRSNIYDKDSIYKSPDYKIKQRYLRKSLKLEEYQRKYLDSLKTYKQKYEYLLYLKKTGKAVKKDK